MNRLADELRAIPREAYLMKRVPQDTHHTDLPESDLCFQVQGSVDENRNGVSSNYPRPWQACDEGSALQSLDRIGGPQGTRVYTAQVILPRLAAGLQGWRACKMPGGS